MEINRYIINNDITEYLNTFYKAQNEDFRLLREKSEEEGVPIILKEAETFLNFYLEKLQPKRILEIGCAVGYSSMFFSQITGAEVVTIEKDEAVYNTAVSNIKELGFSDKITAYNGDGEEIVNQLKAASTEKFDMLFIDAAKSHYKRFLDCSLELLNKDAVIISDNILFRGMVASNEYDPKGKFRTSLRKLREFNEYIMTDEKFSSVILPIGDGIGLTRLK